VPLLYSFAPHYHDYAKTGSMKFHVDGHMLISMMAPRPCTTDRQHDYWSETQREYLARKMPNPFTNCLAQTGVGTGPSRA